MNSTIITSHGDKQITILHDGKVIVIAPADCDKLIVPFHCPVCEYPMKQAQDAQSFREHGCCGMCELCWINNGKIETIDKTTERWKEYLERRHRAFLPQIAFK